VPRVETVIIELPASLGSGLPFDPKAASLGPLSFCRRTGDVRDVEELRRTATRQAPIAKLAVVLDERSRRP
jgi:hypothetical protein